MEKPAEPLVVNWDKSCDSSPRWVLGILSWSLKPSVLGIQSEHIAK